VFRIERGWDQIEGPVEPKSRSGRRVVPISATVRAFLLRRKLSVAWPARAGLRPPRRIAVQPPRPGINRARKAWKRAELPELTPHEARHSYASLMIAAGVNAKALSTYMGHATISVTLDLYGHLLPGAEHEAAAMLDSYLAAALQQSS
jgi:integrase